MSKSDDTYLTILLEEIRDQNTALLEGMKDLPTRGEFQTLKQNVAELKQNVRVIKAAVTDQSKQLYGIRIHSVGNWSS